MNFLKHFKLRNLRKMIKYLEYRKLAEFRVKCRQIDLTDIKPQQITNQISVLLKCYFSHCNSYVIQYDVMLKLHRKFQQNISSSYKEVLMLRVSVLFVCISRRPIKTF